MNVHFSAAASPHVARHLQLGRCHHVPSRRHVLWQALRASAGRLYAGSRVPSLLAALAPVFVAAHRAYASLRLFFFFFLSFARLSSAMLTCGCLLRTWRNLRRCRTASAAPRASFPRWPISVLRPRMERWVLGGGRGIFDIGPQYGCGPNASVEKRKGHSGGKQASRPFAILSPMRSTLSKGQHLPCGALLTCATHVCARRWTSGACFLSKAERRPPASACTTTCGRATWWPRTRTRATASLAVRCVVMPLTVFPPPPRGLHSHCAHRAPTGDYSTKFSPWLAHGCVTSRFIYHEVRPRAQFSFVIERRGWGRRSETTTFPVRRR